VIHLTAIEVYGTSDAGRFAGALKLSLGLQVVSARNSYGKSLAMTALAWCLGIEPIFGIPDNDPSCFPEAVREELELLGHPSARVFSSECSISLAHEDGRSLRLIRAIKGDSSTVRIEEQASGGKIKKSKLIARRQTMQDEHGGLQRFLFEWLGWPREEVTTFRGPLAEIYLENLAPCFYIDQDEGWTNLQALQIGRYGQQQIAEIAVEYLLGATDAIKARVMRQLAAQKSFVLRETARTVAERISMTCLRHGWQVAWSGHGSIGDIMARWSSRTLSEALKQDAEVDLTARRITLNERVELLRRALTEGPIDSSNISAPSEASQRVVELKRRRHSLNNELHTLRTQCEHARELVVSLEHRIHSAQDLLRFKTTGVGRLDHMECPTCHRDLDPATFALSEQSEESISSHIEALKRDRELMSKNVQSLEANLVSASGKLQDLDTEFRDAERALITVTRAIGTIREQIAQIAAELTAAEREIDRILEISNEIDDLQTTVNRWLREARSVTQGETIAPDLQRRRDEFVNNLRQYLTALGHSAVRSGNEALVTLDEQYIPYLGTRRLRSLGSASDQSRLVAAYSLALSAASKNIGGLHPGLVILDEPLQQNPDAPHRELFLTFLSQQLAREAKFQTVIFTWLPDADIARLQEQGTKVITPDGDHFLQLIKSPAQVNQ
jgi:hypothetical protein